jgi:hypothetical protein
MRSRSITVLLLAATLASAGCMRDARPQILGYTFGSMHDERFRTIFVPIVENTAFQAGPLRGLEYLLTTELHKEIERSTPYKVVSNPERADTELRCRIVATPKRLINRNQLNEIREGEMLIQVEVEWRDMHSGEILSQPAPPAFPDPNAQPVPKKPIPKVLVQATGRFIPEVGESQATALQRASKQLAAKIVSQMERPW